MRYGLWGLLLILALPLGGCESAEEQKASQQRYFFLESLKQVESGGRQLGASAPTQAEVTQALHSLDSGLRLAFQVERAFLDDLDLRLGKNFERFFIRGVEHYRIGIEAGDREQQLEGLRLLQQWGRFWSEAGPAISARLAAE